MKRAATVGVILPGEKLPPWAGLMHEILPDHCLVAIFGKSPSGNWEVAASPEDEPPGSVGWFVSPRNVEVLR